MKLDFLECFSFRFGIYFFFEIRLLYMFFVVDVWRIKNKDVFYGFLICCSDLGFFILFFDLGF